MGWEDIQAEVQAGLEEAATELGGAPLRGTLIKHTPAPAGVYPPPEPQETPYPITVLFSRYTPTQIDGVAILSTDVRLLVSAYGLPVEITTDDRIEIGNEVFYVANSPSVRPGGKALMYVVQGRKR